MLELRRRAAASPAVWSFDQVELVLMLSADMERTRAFVGRRLRGLIGNDRQSGELRETLRVYLQFRSSPILAAERLHVSRNTISTRVQRAAARLGRDIDEDALALYAALVLAEVLGEMTISDD